MPLTAPTFLAPLLAHPIAVFGGGVSGEGVCALVAKLGAESVVYDAKGRDFTAADAPRHKLVVFSPGFVPDHPWLDRARAAGAECLGELDFASLFWTGAVVAITGTNGKTTMTEFVTHALRSVGRDATATGNIGHPFSQLAAERDGGGTDATAVCEVSSFQSETLRHFQASSTLWTNFAEDHLERHPGLKAYFDGKWRLVERTAPAGGGRPPPVFAGTSVRRYARQFGKPLDTVTWVETEARPADPGLAGTVFAEYPQRENFILTHAWWTASGANEAPLYAAARSFALGRHRLTRVTEVGGVTFWNDSKATNFHAVEAALSGFTSGVVLIAGGKAKGGDLAAFVGRIGPRVRHIVLIGATAPELARYCAAERIPHTRCGSLAEAVRHAAALASRGEHVLLSPGFASFDQFRNYEDRGEQFEKLVRELAGRPALNPHPTSSSLR